MKLRIKFEKHGAIRFIGHLDVMRYFQKAIRRSEIDVAYTQGFSPHQIMSFAQPLSVGHESNGEYMDIEVNSLTSCEDVMNRLNAVGTEGIKVTSVVVLPDNATNAMASVAAASYTVRFRGDRKPALSFPDTITDFMKQSEILYIKESKKGTREVDLKPGIYALSYDTEASCLKMLLDASSGSNIKPIQVVEALLNMHGETLQENALLVTREDTFTNTGNEDTPVFVPLNHDSLLTSKDENTSES